MRRVWVWGALGGLVAAGAVASGILFLGREEPAAGTSKPADALSLASVPQISVVTTAVVRQPAAPPPDAALEPPVPQTTPPGPSLSELPVEEVEAQPVHAVPETAPASAPHVTIQDRQGRPVARPSTAAPPPPSYVPSVGPASRDATSSAQPPSPRPTVPARNYISPSPPPASYRPSVGPPLQDVASSPPPSSQPPSAPAPSAASAPVEQSASVPTVPSQISGPAHATGTVSLAVAGQSVRLYGVLPPASTDRCAIGTGAPQTCADVTQTVLAAKLARTGRITCQLPEGASAAEPGRICRDAAGADIAGFLVSEGLAVADQKANAGYAEAESTARSNGRGLWRFR